MARRNKKFLILYLNLCVCYVLRLQNFIHLNIMMFFSDIQFQFEENPRLSIRYLWLLRWCKIQSFLLYVFSLILFILVIFFVFSFSSYMYSVSSYVYSVKLYIFSLIIFLFSQVICIQSHFIYIQ